MRLTYNGSLPEADDNLLARFSPCRSPTLKHRLEGVDLNARRTVEGSWKMEDKEAIGGKERRGFLMCQVEALAFRSRLRWKDAEDLICAHHLINVLQMMRSTAVR